MEQYCGLLVNMDMGVGVGVTASFHLTVLLLVHVCHLRSIACRIFKELQMFRGRLVVVLRADVGGVRVCKLVCRDALPNMKRVADFDGCLSFWLEGFGELEWLWGLGSVEYVEYVEYVLGVFFCSGLFVVGR
jgi:hypothetical protein